MCRSHGVNISDVVVSDCHTRNGTAPIQATNCGIEDKVIVLSRMNFISNMNINGTGGALSITACTMQMQESLFRNNTAKDGGGVFISDDANATFLWSTFDENTAAPSGDGGAIRAAVSHLYFKCCQHEVSTWFF